MNSKVAKLADKNTTAGSSRQLGNMMVNYIHCLWLQGNTNRMEQINLFTSIDGF